MVTEHSPADLLAQKGIHVLACGRDVNLSDQRDDPCPFDAVGTLRSVAMKPWLRRLLMGKTSVPAKLLTGLVGPDKNGGWSVSWVGDGVSPNEVRAWTLTQVVDDATAAVVDIYARFPPIETAELQFAIYPWNYDGGPIFEITKRGSEFTAHDTMGSDRTIRAASLEGLVEAIAPDADDNTMLQWIRAVSQLRT